MARTKKKRNKAYAGEDAASSAPTIHRYTAVQRNALQQWWFEKKRFLKPIGITLLVVVAVIWLVVELVRIILR